MRYLLWLVALLLSSSLTPAAPRSFSIDDMLAMRRIADVRVSPDGIRAAFSLRTTDIENNRGETDVYLVNLDGKDLRRLTTHESNDWQPAWAPDGRLLYFLGARSGGSQVWRIAVDGGEAVHVTRLARDVETFQVSPDGRRLILAVSVFPGRSIEQTQATLDARATAKATGRIYDRLFVRHWDAWKDGTRSHLFTFDLTTGAMHDLMGGMDADCPSRPFGGAEEFTVSPDGQTVVFAAKDVGRIEAWSTNFDLFTVPVDGSAAPRRLTSNPAADTQPLFSPDGTKLAYLAMSRAGYEADRHRIIVRDWVSGVERAYDLMADRTPRGDRSPSTIAWTADGKEILSTADHLGQRALFAIDLASGVTRIVVGEGTVVDPQPATGDRIVHGLNSLLGPTEIYSVARDGRDTRRITHINDERLAQTRLGTPERFSFAGARGEIVEGYLVRPVDFDPAKSYPVAMLVHGGPQGSFGNNFHYRWNPQAYAGAGYAALMINFHGSTGYGQAFTDSINDDWGGAPYEDLIKGLDFALARWSFLDGSRAGALGASYGGFMINWMAGRTDRFRCFVVHDGNLDERMAYYDTEELWFPEWDHGGTPWENPSGYSRHNPIDGVKNWKTPTLVVHGARDYRVADTQGISTFTALQRLGVPSKLLYFPDENHWVLQPANSKLWHETVIAWLDQWLKE
ncbi:MAG: S9 family peptidase [Vicinamibacteria bacterium]|nr:S9 family peptidase [Vicinamibacteria bacterium]